MQMIGGDSNRSDKSVSANGFEIFGDSLKTVIIPADVTSIEWRAFQRCSGLTSVTFQGTITADNFGAYSGFEAFDGDLRAKYLAGGPGTYTTTAPVLESNPAVWTKQGGGPQNPSGGTGWTAVTVDDIFGFGGVFSVVYGGGKFVAGGWNGSLDSRIACLVDN